MEKHSHDQPRPDMHRRALATLASAALAFAVAAAGAGSAEAAGVSLVKGISANWSGYAATRTTVSNKFERVAGSWTQPAGNCTRREGSYSATWVGLGGFKRGSRALEQDGSEVDCTPFGQAVYSAWFELVPADPVQLPLKIHAGDSLSASVAVRDSRVIMQVVDHTTGRSRTVVRRMTDPSPDVSSAEWIVEAPSACFSAEVCRTLPLTDFGTVSFTNASATTAQGARTAIAANGYRVTKLELRDAATALRRGRRGDEAPLTGAEPSELLPGYSSFNVAFERLHGEAAEKAASETDEAEEDKPSPPAGRPR